MFLGCLAMLPDTQSYFKSKEAFSHRAASSDIAGKGRRRARSGRWASARRPYPFQEHRVGGDGARQTQTAGLDRSWRWPARSSELPDETSGCDANRAGQTADVALS